MFEIMLKKLRHKKWINLCLLICSTLYMATMISFPLYEGAAYTRMFHDEFNDALTEKGEWPAILTVSGDASSKKDKGRFKLVQDVMAQAPDILGVDEKTTIYYNCLPQSNISSEMKREDLSAGIKTVAMTDIENHIEIVGGESYSETGIAADGAIEVLIGESAMYKKGVLVGETIILENIKDLDGNPIRLLIKGVFRPDNNEDFYWQINDSNICNECFIRMDVFEEKFLGENLEKYSIIANGYFLWDYSNVTYDEVSRIKDKTDWLREESEYKGIIKETKYMDTVEEYCAKASRIQSTLVILQIPVIVMVALALFMISSKMYSVEGNEIAIIKSRGSYRKQIFALYFEQSLVIVIAGAIIGVPLGFGFASVLGSTRNFLEFDMSNVLPITMNTKAMWYAVLAIVFSMLCLTIPAISNSGISIVNFKQQKAAKKKTLWEKLFLDVIALGVSLYGFYTYRGKEAAIADTIASNQSLDPLLYVSSSLFIIGAGLLYLRIQPLIIELIYFVVQKKMGPAGYMAFMENRKNNRKQHMIMLFLVMTISLGIYHATVARSILENAEDNAKYLYSADVVLREKWFELLNTSNKPSGQYTEPDLSKYQGAEWIEKYTKVYNEKKGEILGGENNGLQVTTLGINTKEFGEVTNLAKGLNEKSYHTYLNELAATTDGMLVSSNFATVLGYKVGDDIIVKSPNGRETFGKIVDFVDYFPGYRASETVIDASGTATTQPNYLIVTHSDRIRKQWGSIPYELWIDIKDGCGSREIYDFVNENNITLKEYVNASEELEAVRGDPLLQGTNGVLTLNFVITILLCGIGYMVYWIMAIKERELVFGVLRASGFHRSEVITLLLLEQTFCGVFSCIAGAGIGLLTSRLFAPLLQNAYSAGNQAIPMLLITNDFDMVRLFAVVALMMAVCAAVLIRIVQQLNITKALKLGEE